ncbi:hypothetical protein HYFRA_00011972 [Hymenoscyphus fraxineus]|uniref:Uncharacterized protein n=1 Tax=Hymenoscyphus fraxineus TaxID=746836 RepID=A0A9N9L2E4_9HELO|nr:hypothetical protein HYFRA_00011972 [Hymenoscyphus fraxineus]
MITMCRQHDGSTARQSPSTNKSAHLSNPLFPPSHTEAKMSQTALESDWVFVSTPKISFRPAGVTDFKDLPDLVDVSAAPFNSKFKKANEQQAKFTPERLGNSESNKIKIFGPEGLFSFLEPSDLEAYVVTRKTVNSVPFYEMSVPVGDGTFKVVAAVFPGNSASDLRVAVEEGGKLVVGEEEEIVYRQCATPHEK